MKLLDRWQNRKRDRARILLVADDVEANAGFDMRTYYHDCGTPSCIAGFAHARAMGVAVRKEADNGAATTSYNSYIWSDRSFSIPRDTASARSVHDRAMRRTGRTTERATLRTRTLLHACASSPRRER